MDIKNPYIVSLSLGALVFCFYHKNIQHNTSEEKKKEIKQMKLNYAFLTTLFTFLIMQYYTNTSTTIEPVLKGKFDE